MKCPICGYSMLSEWPHSHALVTQKQMAAAIVRYLNSEEGKRQMAKMDERALAVAKMLAKSRDIDEASLHEPFTI